MTRSNKLSRRTRRGTLTVLAAIGTTLALALPAPAAYADLDGTADCLDQTLHLRRSACIQADGTLIGGGYPCTYGGVDIAVGTMSAEVITDVLSGDITYRWSAPSQVRVNGDCDHETVSLVTYTDERITGGTGVSVTQISEPFRKQVRGQVTVSQAPKWDVNYYRLGGAYVRSVYGKVSVLVEGRFIHNGFEYETGRCKRKTFYFEATPTGPRFEQTSEENQAACPTPVPSQGA